MALLCKKEIAEDKNLQEKVTYNRGKVYFVCSQSLKSNDGILSGNESTAFITLSNQPMDNFAHEIKTCLTD